MSTSTFTTNAADGKKQFLRRRSRSADSIRNLCSTIGFTFHSSNADWLAAKKNIFDPYPLSTKSSTLTEQLDAKEGIDVHQSDCSIYFRP